MNQDTQADEDFELVDNELSESPSMATTLYTKILNSCQLGLLTEKIKALTGSTLNPKPIYRLDNDVLTQHERALDPEVFIGPDSI